MNPGRGRRLDAAILVALVTGGATVVTAVPLFIGGRPAWLVVAHVGAAVAFFVALGLKLALLGARARPGRARRAWRLLVAQLGGVLAAYTLATGVLVVLDPVWSDQHLAASFWLGVVSFVHARHYPVRRGGVRLPREADLGLRLALRRLDAPAFPLLDLSLRKGMSDAALAAVLRVGPDEVAQRRRRALRRLGVSADLAPRLRRLPADAWQLPVLRRRSKRLVVVGGGMAGQALVEQMATRDGGWQITLLAEEDVVPYNRLALSRVVREASAAGGLALRSPAWYRAAAVELRLGSPATRIDVDRRQVADSSGAHHGYDALVLATGSRAFVPPIPGAQLPHVVSYRTLRDAEQIGTRAAAARTAVVIGGGLLGLEAADALAARGVPVTVIEAGPRLMSQQLDGGASALLRRALARIGIETVIAARVTEITASGVRLGDETPVSGNLVVVAAGIRPETALAGTAGLAVDRGIVVDDQLRTSAVRIWAVGECAQHNGVVHGLWAPVAEQVRTAVASLDGEPASFVPSPPETTLKGGLDLFAAGRTNANADEDEIVRSDGRAGTYIKLVVAGDRLVGAIVLGDTAASARLRKLMASGGPVPADILDPAKRARRAKRLRRAGRRDDELVCHCQVVGRIRVERAIEENGLESLEGVAAVTGAGTGCGSCAVTVARMLDERRGARPLGDQPSAAGGSATRSA